MNRKALIIILIVLLVGGGIAYAMTRNAEPAVAPTGDSASSTVTTPATATTTPTRADGAVSDDKGNTYLWSFVAKGENAESGAPITNVSLIVNNMPRFLGEFQGSCSVVSKEQLLENEKTAAVCWFAGGGDELGVFDEGGKVVVKRGVQDEGTAEDGGFRGDFKTILAL